MTNPTHNFDELKPALTGFGQHISEQPRQVKSARIAELRAQLLDINRELEQLLSAGGD